MQLGYSLDILKSDTMFNKKFSELFDGMTYEEAKLFYITNNLKNPINQKS
jgi:hypothetical protein